MAHQAIGVAITMAIATSFKKSFDNNCTMPLTLAPSTLRIPISLLLCSALNAARPNKPRHEINIAINVKYYYTQKNNKTKSHLHIKIICMISAFI